MNDYKETAEMCVAVETLVDLVPHLRKTTDLESMVEMLSMDDDFATIVNGETSTEGVIGNIMTAVGNAISKTAKKIFPGLRSFDEKLADDVEETIKKVAELLEENSNVTAEKIYTHKEMIKFLDTLDKVSASLFDKSVIDKYMKLSKGDDLQKFVASKLVKPLSRNTKEKSYEADFGKPSNVKISASGFSTEKEIRAYHDLLKKHDDKMSKYIDVFNNSFIDHHNELADKYSSIKASDSEFDTVEKSLTTSSKYLNALTFILDVYSHLCYGLGTRIILRLRQAS